MAITLFTPITLGRLSLRNRIVMAPMTRSRAVGSVPNGLMVDYYRLRAGAALIITDATSLSPNRPSYPRIPHLLSGHQEQVSE